MRSGRGKAIQTVDTNPGGGEVIIYQTDNGQVKIDVRLVNGTLWLTQADMAQLFNCSADNISLHLNNIYEEGELEQASTTEDFSVVRHEGNRAVRRKITFYNLDAIISVGYRVKSVIATRFRIWATAQLKEYIIKGFVMDDERLKNPPVNNSEVPDYFDEMLARIRDIRASERRMYLRVREIFKLAADYDPGLTETAKFFSIIQNKLHYAATGLTAAEIIKHRASHLLPNMGLTSWKSDSVRKTDITTAKNYLNEDEIEGLNRIVSMWLDFAEDQAKRRKQIFLKDWEKKLEDFLRFNDRNVLPNSGSVSKKEADDHARAEYEIFEVERRESLEKAGEEDYIRQLDMLAQQLQKNDAEGKK
ncbi:MAG: hydroxyacid dehydrogenase [Erysipelotrichia bacterium]|nr:hydroxyacid dehydrogenase [Erysipelotrichia bacterium]